MVSRAPLRCSRRAVLTGIAGTLSLSAVPVARSAEPQLAADEGIVLYGLPYSLVVRRVESRQLHAQNHFTGWLQTPNEAPIPSVVKAGYCYLYDYDTSASNIYHSPLKEPTDTHGTFQVQSGAVTYLGEWDVELRGVKVTVSVDTIVRARKNLPWLEHYPLYVSMVGRNVVRLPWEQVPQA